MKAGQAPIPSRHLAAGWQRKGIRHPKQWRRAGSSVVPILLGAALLVLSGLVLAAPREEFVTPQQEARYWALIDALRCPKCLNTNLIGSDAPIAQDLRLTVRRQILAGRSDAQIRAFLRARYGDFILYDPPLNPATWALWFGPLLLLLIATWVVYQRVRGGASRPLTPEERVRLDTLLAGKRKRPG